MLAPAHWWFELRALLSSARRRRTNPERMSAFPRGLDHLDVAIGREPNNDAVLRLARAHRLTVFDAAYMELATRQGADLATLDGALIEAARLERVMLVGAPN